MAGLARSRGQRGPLILYGELYTPSGPIPAGGARGSADDPRFGTRPAAACDSARPATTTLG